MNQDYTLKELYELLDQATSRSEVRYIIRSIEDMIQPLKVYYPTKPIEEDD